MPILIFFLCHWFLSLFFQTFFLHRYASHKMFTTNKFWEKTFYFMTFFFQGSSFLNPRAYAIMHRMHHAYSDTEKDPHSPHFFDDVWSMMLETRRIYNSYVTRLKEPENEFKGNYPEWPWLDKVGDSMITRVTIGLIYVAIYTWFIFGLGYSPFFYLLLPIHWLMGPIHGAVVNWCGHKYGYSNYDNGDKSKNTTPVEFLMLGELFQNNHHKYPNSPNFAKKWWEFDPVYPVMKVMHWIRIIQLRKVTT